MATPVWKEPIRGGYPDISWLGLPGADRMGAEARLAIPRSPMHHLVGLRPLEAEPGRVAYEMSASPWFQTQAGAFLGGISAVVADAPLGGAVFADLPPGAFPASSELSMSFLRPASPSSERLIARARLIDAGGRQGLSEATVEDAKGRVIAHTTSRLFIRTVSPPPAPPTSIEPIEQPVYDTPDPWARPLPPELEPVAGTSEVGGLEALRAIIAADGYPGPFAHLFGMQLTEAEEGRIRFRVHTSEWLNSAARAIYGGFLALFVDAAMTFAATTTVPAGGSCASLDLTMHFLRPGIADGRELEAVGSVVHRGRRFAVTQGEVRNPDGKPVIMASGSSMVLPDRPWGSIVVADESQPDED